MRPIVNAVRTAVTTGVRATKSKSVNGKFGKHTVNQMSPNRDLSEQLQANSTISFMNKEESGFSGNSEASFTANSSTEVALASKGISAKTLAGVGASARVAFAKSLETESVSINTIHIPTNISASVQTVASTIRSMHA